MSRFLVSIDDVKFRINSGMSSSQAVYIASQSFIEIITAFIKVSLGGSPKMFNRVKFWRSCWARHKSVYSLQLYSLLHQQMR